MSVDSAGDRMVAVADGLLSVWDRRARSQVGDAARLGGSPNEQRAFRKARAEVRHGRPDQVVVAAPDQPVLVLSLAERWVVARLPVLSATGEIAVDAAGSRLIARTSGGTLELWDIDSGRRVAEPLFAPDALTLVGFSGDGYLVTANQTTDTVQWWDLDRGTESGTVRLGGRFADPRDQTDPLFLSNYDGMPGRLPLTAPGVGRPPGAAVGDWTDAERRALPAGTQDRRPCP